MLGHQLGASGGVEALICSLILDKKGDTAYDKL